jgi:DNA polymerase III delta prime subunit
MQDTTASMTIQDITAQAGQVVSLAPCRERALSETARIDNPEYLQGLEQEGVLLVANAWFRRHGEHCAGHPDYFRVLELAGLTPADTHPDKLAGIIAATEKHNQARGSAPGQAVSRISFPRFCREHKLDGFHRRILLILLLAATSRRFTEIFDLCRFEGEARNGNRIKAGIVLDIICRDYREQLACRKSFSQDSPLMSREIVCLSGYYDEASSIFEKKISLYERFVNKLIGDESLYKNSAGMIRRETGTIRLDQVVLPEDTKTEIVSRLENYIVFRSSPSAKDLDEFYGYGTGLVMLFYGPSGSGKTMMAQALSSHFNRPLFSLRMSEFRRRDIYIPAEEVIGSLFMEAAINSGIAFFDEADDFFENDSYLGSHLLTHIEQARCVVILSTNKPVDLDPAMDRRLSLKVHFDIPDEPLRRKMWQALMPDFVKPAPDVDFDKLAKRYHFTGGLIKNSIFMAIGEACMPDHQGSRVITMDMIEQAADLQNTPMVDMSDLVEISAPRCGIEDLQILPEQKAGLANAAKAYRAIDEQQLGLNILITSSDADTGINVAHALACACDMKVRKFDFMDLYLKNGKEDKILDPVTQKKIAPMEYAFAECTGDASLLLIVDYLGAVKWNRKGKSSSQDDFDRRGMQVELRSRLRDYRGLFCLVTVEPLGGLLPVEFNMHFHIEYPPAEEQLQCWRKHLPDSATQDSELDALVRKHPMHIAEIDFIARQAAIQSTIRTGSGCPGLEDIQTVIARYRPENREGFLFGRQQPQGQAV